MGFNVKTREGDGSKGSLAVSMFCAGLLGPGGRGACPTLPTTLTARDLCLRPPVYDLPTCLLDTTSLLCVPGLASWLHLRSLHHLIVRASPVVHHVTLWSLLPASRIGDKGVTPQHADQPMIWSLPLQPSSEDISRLKPIPSGGSATRTEGQVPTRCHTGPCTPRQFCGAIVSYVSIEFS